MSDAPRQPFDGNQDPDRDRRAGSTRGAWQLERHGRSWMLGAHRIRVRDDRSRIDRLDDPLDGLCAVLCYRDEAWWAWIFRPLELNGATYTPSRPFDTVPLSPGAILRVGKSTLTHDPLGVPGSEPAEPLELEWYGPRREPGPPSLEEWVEEWVEDVPVREMSDFDLGRCLRQDERIEEAAREILRRHHLDPLGEDDEDPLDDLARVWLELLPVIPDLAEQLADICTRAMRAVHPRKEASRLAWYRALHDAVLRREPLVFPSGRSEENHYDCEEPEGWPGGTWHVSEWPDWPVRERLIRIGGGALDAEVSLAPPVSGMHGILRYDEGWTLEVWKPIELDGVTQEPPPSEPWVIVPVPDGSVLRVGTVTLTHTVP